MNHLNNEDNPLGGYLYISYRCEVDQEWYDITAKEDEPYLPIKLVKQLEDIYSKDSPMQPKEHEQNLNFLFELSTLLTNAWTGNCRKEANMCNLELDYKKYFELSTTIE
ncbi:MAG: hypothetical protein Q8N88_05705 [Nanoarchaeota archaeon]|nr:hypothetical protein [Nanoarchaeota archaeon]